VTLSDRIKRWWSPAKWRDEHPEDSYGEDDALSDEELKTKYGLDKPQRPTPTVRTTR
jgi:hypothetical protein